LPYRLFFDLVPPAHIAFLEALVPYHRTPDAIYVHGGVDVRCGAVGQQLSDAVIWGPDGFPEFYDGIDTIVYGHRDNAVVGRDGWPRPLVLNRTIGIDTISHGVLTAVELPGGRILQSRRYPSATGRTP
jgi:hypothetical protein